MDLNRKYFELLYKKRDLASENIILKDDNNESKVIPYSISYIDDEDEFRLYRYEDLSKDLVQLKDIDLKVLKMQAGLGSSVERDDIVNGSLSAKGVDLKLKVYNQNLPIAKCHLLVVKEIRSRNIYKSIKIQNLVNEETIDDINELCKEFDVMPNIEQIKMPTIDKDGQLTTMRQAPCGHGFVGFHEIIDALKSSNDEIVCIGNGEDINSTIDSKITSLVVSKSIPILMITTNKTPKDLKGGQIALVKEQIPYLTIVEKAQAQRSNQLDYFEKLGLRQNDKKALFNTNVAVINKKAFRDAVSANVKDFDLEKFLEQISPNVIKNTKIQDDEPFIQLESALGSVLLNTDKFFREKFGVKILSILNLSETDREKFFLPIKSRSDYDFIKSNYKFDEADLKFKRL